MNGETIIDDARAIAILETISKLATPAPFRFADVHSGRALALGRIEGIARLAIDKPERTLARDDQSLTLPREMTAAIAEVIGTPCFACIQVVGALRELGHEIARKAEAEQAAYIWFLLPFAIRHGREWRFYAAEELKRQRAAKAGT